MKTRNQQDGLIVEDLESPVQFARPPKVLPTSQDDGKGYVLGHVRNSGETAVEGVVIRAVVRSGAGEVLETKMLQPQKPSIAPGGKVLFSGMLDRLAPDRTEFSVGAESGVP